MAIYSNKAQCRHCLAVIESRHTHDFVACECGMISVDGGRDYLKRSFQSPDDVIELSVFSGGNIYDTNRFTEIQPATAGRNQRPRWQRIPDTSPDSKAGGRKKRGKRGKPYKRPKSKTRVGIRKAKD